MDNADNGIATMENADKNWATAWGQSGIHVVYWNASAVSKTAMHNTPKIGASGFAGNVCAACDCHKTSIFLQGILNCSDVNMTQTSILLKDMTQTLIFLKYIKYWVRKADSTGVFPRQLNSMGIESHTQKKVWHSIYPQKGITTRAFLRCLFYPIWAGHTPPEIGFTYPISPTQDVNISARYLYYILKTLKSQNKKVSPNIHMS